MIERLGPSPDIVEICRLYLDRLLDLTAEERRVFTGVIAILVQPPVLVRESSLSGGTGMPIGGDAVPNYLGGEDDAKARAAFERRGR